MSAPVSTSSSSASSAVADDFQQLVQRVRSGADREVKLEGRALTAAQVSSLCDAISVRAAMLAHQWLNELSAVEDGVL